MMAILTVLAISLHAQESMLAMKYSVGQTLKYKLTSNTQHEGSMFPGGRLETLGHLYYTLNVTEVDNEGTATVTFTQDSIQYWENSEKVPYEAGDALNGVPITMWFSNRSILVDAIFPENMSNETYAYLDGLVKDFASEPPLPGRPTGVGAEWKNDLAVYFIYAESSVKTSNDVKSKYVRKENFRGRETARIEYSGNLILEKQKVGFVSGTMHYSPRDGKVLRISSKTDATFYATVRGGRAQMRVSNTQTRETLN
jgi:hypothetical protein